MANVGDRKEVMYSEVTRQIEVKVDPMYVADQSRPEDDYFFFAYRVRIRNDSPVGAQLLGRHWVIVDGNGHKEEVRGSGVVGQQPRLEPGEEYEYTSFCPLGTPTGNMRGTYQLVDDRGEKFDIKIPLFFFRVPEMLH